MKQFSQTGSQVYKVGNRFKRDVVVKTYRTDDGLEHEFTTFFAEESVAPVVLAMTAEGEIILMHEFRPGPNRWMYNLPGGGAEPGEDAQEAVERELLEETGYVAGKIEYCGDSYEAPYNNTVNSVFFASDCVYDESSQLDATETSQGARAVLVSPPELLALACKGEICNSGMIFLALEHLDVLKHDILVDSNRHNR